MDRIALRTQLQSGLNQIALDLSEEQVDKLLDYLALLHKWNKVYNLTAIRDPREMLVKHLLDSLAVVPHISSDRLIDVGTGGGLPGIPLAICYPDRKIDLLDSNSKKTRFLIQAKAELGLIHTEVLHQRVEEYQPSTLYDGVVSRAFASMQDMLHWTEHLLKSDGHWWAMKAQKEFEDYSNLPGLVKIDEIIDLQVPGLDAQRILVKASKETDS
ncbi:16S rRNA (guanine(527)-N(7))-methyltransferase RsmG [Thiomicrorhabdus sp. zzn3]|uniref:16S rRNA (guanine(527)-N(7))-methyltransferase RsmG n=1 Tax=Thiomicrorhabdus sp. zzn3 TaxID=3039775 RepID=UPI0024364942|nr:16S rRNA (guanine(527)-N(7))-methyltransferase RsmG [Thiomicrorhabdus sp. zzn3]MDG6778716.1 16S rRNA (guanine(527)-N(7))-methyltransferase RsmG [Thiomicrorhabdus sp. zzn3]